MCLHGVQRYKIHRGSCLERSSSVFAKMGDAEAIKSHSFIPASAAVVAVIARPLAAVNLDFAPWVGVNGAVNVKLNGASSGPEQR